MATGWLWNQHQDGTVPKVMGNILSYRVLSFSVHLLLFPLWGIPFTGQQET